jgi:hypothetical protein
MGVALRKGVEGEGWIEPLTVPTSLEKGWEREVNPYLLSTVPLYRITNSHCEHGVYYHICVTHTRVQSLNFKQSMGARNRGGIGLSYRPARLHRLAEFITWNRFPGYINV